MRSFAPLAVSTALLSTVLASGSANDHSRRLQKRNGHGAAAPQWIKRRSNMQKRQGSVPVSPALLLTVSNATAAATNATIPDNTTVPVVATPSYNSTALWFDETGSQSACYTVHNDTDFVVGLSTAFWPDTGVVSPYCGQYLAITDPATGASVTALISDASGNNYTTLTRAAFSALADLVIGEIPITFTFLNATTNSTSNSTSSASIPLLAVSTALPTSTVVSTSTVLPASITSAPVVVATPATSTSTVDSASILAAEALVASVSSDSAASKASADASASSASQASVWAAEASASSASAKAQADKDAAASADAAEASARAQASQDAAAAESSAEAAAAWASSSAAQAAASASAKAASAAADASREAAAAAAASPTKVASSSSSKTYTGGQATYFTQNGVAGACGAVNVDSAMVIAIDSAMYDNGANCGRTITITRVDTGATVTAVVADECPTCNNGVSLDLSEGAFRQIATYDEGEVNISWHFDN